MGASLIRVSSIDRPCGGDNKCLNLRFLIKHFWCHHIYNKFWLWIGACDNCNYTNLVLSVLIGWNIFEDYHWFQYFDQSIRMVKPSVYNISINMIKPRFYNCLNTKHLQLFSSDSCLETKKVIVETLCWLPTM